MGMLGLTLGDLLRMESRANDAGSSKFGKAKSILHIFLPGGMAQQESFDPKPYAPLEYRGSFGVTNASVSGKCLFRKNRIRSLAIWW